MVVERRNRLPGEKAEISVFVKDNLPIMLRKQPITSVDVGD